MVTISAETRLPSCSAILSKDSHYRLIINSGHKMPRQGSDPVLQSCHMVCTKMLTLNCGHHQCRDKAPVLFYNPVKGFPLYAEYKFCSQNAKTRLPTCSAILSKDSHYRLIINSGHKMPRQGSDPVLQSCHMVCTKMLTLNCGHHPCRDKAPVLFSNPVKGFALYAEYKLWSPKCGDKAPILSCNPVTCNAVKKFKLRSP